MNCKYAQMFIINIFSSMNFKQAFRIIPALIKALNLLFLIYHHSE